MKKYLGYIVTFLLGLAIGYFAGREHIKYELRSAFTNAAADFSKSFGPNSNSTQSDPSTRTAHSDDTADSSRKRDAASTSYIKNNLELYDVSAEYQETYSGKEAGISYKIRNNGTKTLNLIYVTFYFKNSDGNVITEKTFHPVSKNSFGGGENGPLKPGYIWQVGEGKYYSADNVPSEWKEGSVDASITKIEFAE